MPRNIPELARLRGLNEISEEERQRFRLTNADALKAFRNPQLRKQAENILYNNKMFIDHFGKEKFDALNNGSEEAYNLRNQLLKEDIVNTAWDKQFGDMDDVWKQKYGQLPTDYKQKVLESDWLKPKEFEENFKNTWQKDIKEANKIIRGRSPFFVGNPTMPGTENPEFYTIDEDQEAVKQRWKEVNDRTLEHIYNDAVDEKANGLEEQVAKAHLSPEITQLEDKDVDEWFKRAVTPGSYTDQYGRPNAGIPEFAKFYVENPDGGEDMQNMSIDEKRKVLAMKKVYEENMDPEMAKTALNNYAMRYNKDHQSSWDKAEKFGKDVLIAATSYSADKVNSIYNVGLFAADKLSDIGVLDKPEVWIDDQGNIVDENTSAITKDAQGRMVHQGADGQPHFVHREQVDRRTLHNMGVDLGYFDPEWLNPQDWTNREAMGVWSKDLAKEYQKLGTSPYKVVYEPNDDRDLMYESFKMMSFGLADGAAQLIPFGVGQVGRFLSSADRIGRIGRGFGNVVNWAGRHLTAQTKTGQLIQGLAGAGGIAYAYQRGSFGETLQQNLANAEEAALNRSKQEVYDEYQNNEQYKSVIDAQVAERAAAMKADYMKNLGAEGQGKIVDEKTLDEMIKARAQDAVLSDAVQDKLSQYKGSDEYAALQNEAINSAGDAAWTTFWPEAVKYGLVNTMGYRKWMYSNPTGLKNKVAAGLQGLREVTTPAGRQRLATETSKFLTNGQKWKALGKAAGSQIWGGAWTNGTDDMMVDAAERINEDSFDRYLRAFEKGESIADVYGFADGTYSYWKGLNNSLGQETTWEAATVGGLGSVLSFTPNMANIAHVIATKEGRQMYRDNFMREYERNEDGSVKRDEQGNPLYKKIGWKENWRDRANYFIQNGVLNTYYGAKQNERDLQQHADYVNMLLDDYDDFKVIEDLVTSDIALEDAETVGDQKTMRFVKAINAMNALERLAQNENDPTTLSSVVQNAQEFIRKAANMQMEGEDAFTEEEMNNMLAQYYAQNPGIPQSEANNQVALYQISKNAQKLQEASEAMNRAEEEVLKIERSIGKKIDPAVRAKMKMDQALDPHWRERIQQMQDELDDTSDINGEVSVDNLIPSVGGRKNAEALVKVYDKQQTELQKEMEEQKKKTQELKDKLDTAIANRRAATTSEERYNTQKTQDEAQAKYDDALQQEDYLRGLGTRTTEKKNKVIEALNNQIQDDSGKYQEKVLTADEIFGLDAVTRARMLNPQNRQLYSDAQQREIRKLEDRLLMRDADALTKMQDIARLSQRIQQNQDAYSRMAQNPEAATVALEAQRQQEADAAYKLINQRNAETVADFINQFEEGMQGHDDVTQDQKNEFVFRALRKMNPTLLDIIDGDNLLPQYQQQVQDAKEWGKTVDDVKAVIDNAEESQQWKDNVMKNIEQVVESANNRDDIMASLEQVIDDVQNPQVAQDFEKVLNGLEQLGYQRDATVIENRKQRKEREAAEAQAKKEAEEDAKIAAAEAAAKAAEEANAQQAQEVKPDGSNLQAPFDIAPIDQSEDNAVQQGELSEAIDLTEDTTPTEEWETNPEVKITRDIANNEFKESYTDAASEDYVDKNEQSKLKTTVDYLNGKMNDHDYLVAMGMATGQGSWLDSPSTTKEEITKEAQKRAEARKKYLKQNKKTGSSVNNNMEEHRIIDNGDSVQGKSATIEEQLSEPDVEGGKEVYSSVETQDYAAQNGTGEHVIETSANSLSGNAMSEWKPEPLQNEGKLDHKHGAKPDDSMSKYYAWMDAAGIKLQNIIDEELAQILRLSPQAKVKFMVVRPENNATKDINMKTHLMLVLDYDNKVNKGITSIHRDENGGVLESNGKKYLVIGTVGYGNRNADKLALYDILFSNNPRSANGYGLVKRGQGEFFRNHPGERFYVPENLSTEVVPMSLIPGYIVKQLEKDENPQTRSIKELLADPERNPQGVEFNDLAWGVQERTQYLTVGVPRDRVMVPRNPEANNGAAFVLIPASNGKMVPSYLRPLFYNEMRDGELKDEVMQLLENVVSPDYNTRLEAVKDLSNIFHMDKDGQTILLMKSKPVISLVRDGKTFATFTLDENFDRQQFIEAFSEMNPRVNITKSVLQSNVLLQRYDEAGALQTDLARLTTAGSSYSIYGLNANGEMLKPEVVNNDIPKTTNNSDFRNSDRRQVPFKHQYYNYDKNEGKYYLNGVPVTDDALVNELEVNRRIIESGLAPVESQGSWGIYILSEGEHPEVVKVHRNTKEVKQMSEQEAIQLIDKVNKEKAEQERAEAAKKALEEQKAENVEDVNLGEEGLVVDEETGELITPDELRQRQAAQAAQFGEKEKIEEEGEAPVQPQGQEDKLHKSGAQLESSNVQGSTQTFSTLAKSKQWRKLVSETIKQKWPDAPRNMTELERFLKSKNVEVDAIGTSDTAVKAWLRTIIDCR